jgi:hypothetical protein
MKTMNILVAGCIFSSMFGSAWYMNEKIKRDYVDSSTFEESIFQLTNTETPIGFLTKEANLFEKFKPREYVRVVAR